MFHFDYPVNLLFAPGNAQPLRPGEGKTSPFTFPWEMRKRHYWIYWDSRAAFHLMLRQEWQGILRWISFCYHMGMDQYLLIPFLGGWTSINPSYFDVNYRRAIGFDTLPYQIRTHTRLTRHLFSDSGQGRWKECHPLVDTQGTPEDKDWEENCFQARDLTITSSGCMCKGDQNMPWFFLWNICD